VRLDKGRRKAGAKLALSSLPSTAITNPRISPSSHRFAPRRFVRFPRDGHVLFEDNTWVAALSHSLALSHPALALSNSNVPALTNLYDSLVQEIKRWVYRDGLPPPTPDTSYLRIMKLQPLKKITVVEEVRCERTRQICSLTRLITKHDLVLSLQWPMRSYLKIPNSYSESTTSRMSTTESQTKINSNQLTSLEQILQLSPPDPNPRLLKYLQTKFNSLSQGDCVLFHIPLHRNLAQTILSYCKLLDSEVQENISTFMKPIASSVIPPAVCQSGEEVVLSLSDGGSSPQSSESRVLLSNEIAAAKTVHAIVDFRIRAIVAWRQIAESRMWLRNGQSCVQLAINYAIPPLCRSLRDLDLTLLQFSAATHTAGLGPSLFWDLLVTRFSLDGYLTDLVSKAPLDGWVDPPKLQYAEHSHFMLESFFHTLNVMLAELPPPPSDDTSVMKKIVRRELLHTLASAGSCTFSECFSSAVSGVTVNEGDAPPEFQGVFQEVMGEIAVEARSSRGATAKTFELRTEVAVEYDPTFFHLSRRAHQAALEKISQLRTKIGGCPPIVQPLPPRCHKLFESARSILLLPQAFPALRRSLLLAILSGNWVPPLQPTQEEEALRMGIMGGIGTFSSSPAMSSMNSMRSASPADLSLGSRSRSDSTATSDSASPSSVFSSATITSSCISLLEVVQFATLQFHQLAVEGDEKREFYISEITSNMSTLPPDSWFLVQLPTCTPASSRTSVLGFLSIMYEFWGSEGADESQSKTNDQEAESESSGARALVTSGLAFLLRALDVLLSSPSSTSIDSIREAAATGVRPPSASSPHSAFPPLPKLWPTTKMMTVDSASSPDAAKKHAAKNAQAKAIERMKSLQNKFASANVEELKADDEDDESLCIICRCSNGEPLGYIAHAQRCRTVPNSVAKDRTEMGKLCMVVGDLGCQLRATSDLKSMKLDLIKETGTIVKVLEHSGEKDSSPLHSRRVLVEGGGKKGWASYVSSSGYPILRPLTDDAKKQRWGATRPLLTYCSHIAHTACVEKHVLSLHQKSADGVQYMGYYSADIKSGEFLCPLCNSISNILVPKAAKEDKDASKEEELERMKPAVERFKDDLLNSMQAPHIQSRRIDSDNSHYLTGQWDAPKLVPYRALLVSFSAIGYGASSLQQQFDFNLSNIEITMSAMKILVKNYDREASKVKETILDQFYLRMPSVWKRAKDEPKTAYDEICSFISGAPTHVAMDGTLDQGESGRSTVASAYWLQRERARSTSGEKFFYSVNKDKSPPYNSIPMPFGAFVSEVEAEKKAQDEASWIDAELVGSAWPLLPILSWDLTTFAGAIFAFEVEAGEVATVMKLLILARAVQILVCDIDESQDLIGSDGLASSSGDSICNILIDMKEPLRAKVGQKLTPFLKVFLVVAKASSSEEVEFLQSVEDILYEEDAFDILDGLGLSWEDIFAEEVETVSAWIDDLKELDRWQDYNSGRKREEVLGRFKDELSIDGLDGMDIEVHESIVKSDDEKFSTINGYFSDVGSSPILSPQLSMTGSTKIRVSSDIVTQTPGVVRDFSHELSVCPTLDFDPFVELPKMFVDLYAFINQSESLSEDEEEKVEFAIDLVSGRVIRAGKASDAAGRLGRCTSMARKNGGIGIFFLLSKATILLISGLRAVYWGSIFLDKNGEEDLGLKRGRPLFLNEPRLQKLRDLYLKNEIVKEVAALRSNSERVIREGWY